MSAARSTQTREQRAARSSDFIANVNDPRHGSQNGYSNLDCRCGPCTAAWAAYHRAYMERHAEQRAKARDRSTATTWGMSVPLLKQGYRSAASVARLLGIHVTTVLRQDTAPTFITPNGRTLWSPAAVRVLAEAFAKRDLERLTAKYSKVLSVSDVERLTATLVVNNEQAAA